ncbi:MAG: TolC family protein [Actinomycetota bacterium]
MALLLAGALVSGCSAPDELADIGTELSNHAQTVPASVAARPLTVDDAVALAVRYNLDARTKVLEEVIAAGKADLSLFALLPQIAANGGMVKRNPPSLSTSRDISTGAISTAPSSSEDAFKRTGDLTASWNLVDFGIALLRSGQEEDKVAIAGEKRRRAMHTLVQDVQVAYWKSVVNEFAARKYAALELKLVRAVQNAESAERTKVGDPMQMLAYQRAIVDTMRQISELQRQTATARAELAGLMGMPSPSSFQLADIETTVALKAADLDRSMPEMEAFALAHRPEIKTEEAQFRIDVEDVHAEMLKSLPGIGPFIGGHFDSNSFLIHNSWADAGLKVAWNLVELVNAPKRIDQAKAVAEVTRARRLAMGMAVLTQVHVADLQYKHALKEYRLTEHMAEIDRRINDLAGKSREAGSGSPMEEIKAEAASMLSTLRRFIIYSDLQGAKARLNTAMGLDPTAGSLPEEPPAAQPEPPAAQPEPPAAQPEPQAAPMPPEPVAAPAPPPAPMTTPMAAPVTTPPRSAVDDLLDGGDGQVDHGDED